MLVHLPQSASDSLLSPPVLFPAVSHTRSAFHVPRAVHRPVPRGLVAGAPPH